MADEVDLLFSRLPAHNDDAAFRYKVHSTHVAFHMWIAEHARSQLLKQMIERKHVLILNWLFDVTGRRTALPLGFHAALADALIAGDPDKADAVMRSHVRYGLAEIAGQIGALGASEWRERRKAVDGRS
jgi:DNA-binding GntR family transcriptional regulator